MSTSLCVSQLMFSETGNLFVPAHLFKANQVVALSQPPDWLTALMSSDWDGPISGISVDCLMAQYMDTH